MTLEFLSRTRHDLATPASTRRLNRALFGAIASRYDVATRCLSLGRDAAWKDRLVAALPALPAPVCLDVACGTGDLTRRVAARYPAGTVIGLDLTEAMLTRAQTLTSSSRIRYVLGDMGRIALPDGSVDLVTGGYALRNAGDVTEALREIHRVLRPGGTAVFLDFSKAGHPLLRRIELAILRVWGGVWGWLLHRDPRVYTYIADSLARYPDAGHLAGLFRETGFANLRTRRAFAGIISCLAADKPNDLQDVRPS
jgi:demethylmenaquinone methyltransferase/2-methoxy-6-polyprenyl-1,4-benzoquinol methylase